MCCTLQYFLAATEDRRQRPRSEKYPKNMKKEPTNKEHCDHGTTAENRKPVMQVVVLDYDSLITRES
jgi:hypothetical protein